MEALAQPLMNGPRRDLLAARDAYRDGDVEKSKTAHSSQVAAHEKHMDGGGRVKSIVFGGLDGILTSFAVVAGAVGVHLGPVVIIAMGVSNVMADALAMGAGEYLSSRAYNKYVQQELEREKWELENFPDGEVVEMIELFESRGMSREDATVVVTRMAKCAARANLDPPPLGEASSLLLAPMRVADAASQVQDLFPPPHDDRGALAARA